MSDRRARQAQQKKIQQAQAEVGRTKAEEKLKKTKVEEAKDNLEHTKYLADKAEHRAESYLERMRSGYAEGAKLFFDSFRTQATLTTGSILVIAALSEGLLPTNVPYRPLLWFSYASLLFSMLAALKTMDVITVNVFMTLTTEDRPRPVTPGSEGDAQTNEEEETRKADALKQQGERNLKTLTRRSRWASWSFYSGIGAFALFVVMPPLVDFFGIVGAVLVVAGTALATSILYRRF
jgi:hypothetical protein